MGGWVGGEKFAGPKTRKIKEKEKHPLFGEEKNKMVKRNF